MSISNTSARDFLLQHNFFQGLPTAAFNDLINEANIQDYPRTSQLFLQGDKPRNLYVLQSGWVKLYRESYDGDEMVIAMCGPGDIFGQESVFDDTHQHSAEVIKDASIITIPVTTLHAQSKLHPEIGQQLVKAMADEIRYLHGENEHLALMNAPQRLGCLLLRMASGRAGIGGTFHLPYDKHLAAKRLGITVETFSRTLAKLKPHGVTVKGSEVTIENFQKLAAYCCPHCSSSPEDGYCTDRFAQPARQTTRE